MTLQLSGAKETTGEKTMTTTTKKPNETERCEASECSDLLSVGVCPDYDEDCKDVVSPTDCFLGWMPCLRPLGVNVGVAEGLCPEMRNR